MFFYKETAFGFGCSFWLHQRGIPRRTWRLYCSLRGHQRTGTAGFANPSFATEPRKRGSLDSPLSNPGESLRRDIGLPRAYRDIGFRCPVQVANPHFDVRIGCFVFDPVSFAFQSGLFGIFRTFFIIGWKKDAVCVAFLLVFWITADREMVPISLDASPFHQIGWAEEYCKNAFVRFRLLMIWYSITVSAKTIDPTAVSANPTKSHSKNLM